MDYVVTTDNSIASQNIIHALETIKSVVKVFVVPTHAPKAKPTNVPTDKAMAFIDSLSVKSGRKVPADERGIEARLEKY